ncbi:MAG: SoxR reducing system RseC family protein [Paludibacteraceae bacterium]|nr:SoxR reducing system RseC family protein [Paludibacteraceae bacterium]
MSTANNCKLEHTGTVVELTTDGVKVRVEQRAACAGCASQASCTLSTEKKDEIITVACSNPTLFQVGETVKLVSTRKKLYTALFWAYILPLVGLLASVVVCMELYNDELIAAVSGLAFCALYVLVLYCLPKRITRPLQIEIEKLV